MVGRRGRSLNKQGLFVLMTAFFLWSGAGVGALAFNREGRTPIVNWEDLRAGDVVAEGRLSFDAEGRVACSFDTFVVRIPITKAETHQIRVEKTLVLGSRQDSPCTLEVQSKERTASEDPSAQDTCYSETGWIRLRSTINTILAKYQGDMNWCVSSGGNYPYITSYGKSCDVNGYEAWHLHECHDHDVNWGGMGTTKAWFKGGSHNHWHFDGRIVHLAGDIYGTNAGNDWCDMWWAGTTSPATVEYGCIE